MSDSALRSLFKRLAKASGVTRLHPYLCRHTFATRYLLNGGDVFSLQQILGHTTLEMVRRYVSLASAPVAVQHRKFSPMDRIGLDAGKSRALAGLRNGRAGRGFDSPTLVGTRSSARLGGAGACGICSVTPSGPELW